MDLETNTKAILTDSRIVQKEDFSLKVPCIILSIIRVRWINLYS